MVRSWRWRYFVIVLLTALYGYEIIIAKSCPMRADWRTATRYVLEHRQQGETIIVTPGVLCGIVNFVSPVPNLELDCLEQEGFLDRMANYWPKRASFWVLGLFFFNGTQAFEENVRLENYDFELHSIPGSPPVRVYHLTPRKP